MVVEISGWLDLGLRWSLEMLDDDVPEQSSQVLNSQMSQRLRARQLQFGEGPELRHLSQLKT